MGILEFIFENIFAVSFVNGSHSFPPPLSDEEEDKYLRQYSEGDADAKNILIEHNLRLVAHVTKKYQSSGMDADDLISIGTIGLIKAVSTYNCDKKIRLATYAARCIENEVLMVLRSSKKLQNEVSINEPIGFDKSGNEISLIDILDSDQEDITEKIALKSQVKRLYTEMKKVLHGRERLILEHRYGLAGKQSRTQREISKAMGISRSYVSRIEKKAVDKLRRAFES